MSLSIGSHHVVIYGQQSRTVVLACVVFSIYLGCPRELVPAWHWDLCETYRNAIIHAFRASLVILLFRKDVFCNYFTNW